jgi:hypothetical protein
MDQEVTVLDLVLVVLPATWLNAYLECESLDMHIERFVAVCAYMHESLAIL